MPDDLTKPPETPPGDPTAAAAPSEPPAVTAKPAEPTFTLEQVSDRIATGIRDGFKALATPVDTPPPAGPDPATLKAKVGELDGKIEEAMANGQPIMGLIRQRDELRDQVFELERVAPLRSQGGTAINELVINQLSSDPDFADVMQHYRDEVMALLKPAMNAGVLRLDVAKEAANLVGGRHRRELIMRAQEEAARAKKIEGESPMPGSTNGRVVNAPDVSRETVRELFGERAEAALDVKRSRRGTSEDFEAQKLGYANRQEWFKHVHELDKVAVETNRSFGLDK